MSQRWVVQARWMSCRVMMAVLVRAMRASIEVCAALGADLEPAQGLGCARRRNLLVGSLEACRLVRQEVVSAVHYVPISRGNMSRSRVGVLRWCSEVHDVVSDA